MTLELIIYITGIIAVLSMIYRFSFALTQRQEGMSGSVCVICYLIVFFCAILKVSQ